MMKYISKFFIRNLILSSDIKKIISGKINLKKIGGRYKAICPFHQENNPSFIINEIKKYYYCFGCKVHGNIVDFLMNYNKISFIDSIKELAVLTGLKLVYSNNRNINYFLYDNNNCIFYKYMVRINSIYVNTLFNKNNKFFIKKLFDRGLNFDSIKEYSLGYSSFYKISKLINTYSHKEINILLKFGVFFKKNNHINDRFLNRITFPIYDINGRIIAFGGRSLSKENISKYINSVSNIFFSKKNCIYGLYNILKKNIFKLDKILVVEGYIDVIMLNQFGIKYTVGLLGTSISDIQIKILFKYTNKIIFCYDGDLSGIESSKRIISKLIDYIDEKKSFYFIFLPFGEDP